MHKVVPRECENDAKLCTCEWALYSSVPPANTFQPACNRAHSASAGTVVDRPCPRNAYTLASWFYRVMYPRHRQAIIDVRRSKGLRRSRTQRRLIWATSAAADQRHKTTISFDRWPLSGDGQIAN